VSPGIRSVASTGSCGAAALLQRPVIVSDTEGSPHWTDLRDVAARYQVRACWSLPIADDHGQLLLSMRHLSTVASIVGDPYDPLFGEVNWFLASPDSEIRSDLIWSTAVPGAADFRMQHNPHILPTGELAVFDSLEDDRKAVELARGLRLCREVGGAPQRARAAIERTDSPLDKPLESLPGLGPVSAGKLADRGVERVGDLLFAVPRRYDDARAAVPLADIDPDEVGDRATVVAEVESVSYVRRGGRKRWLDVRFGGGIYGIHSPGTMTGSFYQRDDLIAGRLPGAIDDLVPQGCEFRAQCSANISRPDHGDGVGVEGGHP